MDVAKTRNGWVRACVGVVCTGAVIPWWRKKLYFHTFELNHKHIFRIGIWTPCDFHLLQHRVKLSGCAYTYRPKMRKNRVATRSSTFYKESCFNESPTTGLYDTSSILQARKQAAKCTHSIDWAPSSGVINNFSIAHSPTDENPVGIKLEMKSVLTTPYAINWTRKQAHRKTKEKRSGKYCFRIHDIQSCLFTSS